MKVGKLNPNRIHHARFVGAIERLCTQTLNLRKAVTAWDLRDIMKINSHRIHVARQDDVEVLGCLTDPRKHRHHHHRVRHTWMSSQRYWLSGYGH